MVDDTLTLKFPDVDVDDDGSPETDAVFEFRNYRLTQMIRTGFLVGNDNGTVRQIIVDKVTDPTVGGVSKYRDVHINEGTGNRVFEVEFQAADGHKTPTWGDDKNEPRGSVANATGQGPLERVQVFEHYLSALTEDSRNPITLEVGGYRPGGLFDNGNLDETNIQVVVESPSVTYDGRDDPSRFRGEIRLVETISNRAVVSAAEDVAPGL